MVLRNCIVRFNLHNVMYFASFNINDILIILTNQETGSFQTKIIIKDKERWDEQ